MEREDLKGKRQNKKGCVRVALKSNRWRAMHRRLRLHQEAPDRRTLERVTLTANRDYH